MITLFQGPRAWGTPNISPFCTKLETYLRMTELEYKTAPFSPSQAPKGKMPYIQDGDVFLGDSNLIIAYLKETYGDPLDAHLTPLQHAQGHCLKRMLEEGCYYVSVYSRWYEDSGYEVTKDAIFGELPAPVRWMVAPMVRRKIKQAVVAQGTGRHTPEEIYALGDMDISATSQILGEGPFLFGDRPCSYDAILFAFVVGMTQVPFDSRVKSAAESHANLIAHRDLMAKTYFQDIMKVETL